MQRASRAAVFVTLAWASSALRARTAEAATPRVTPIVVAGGVGLRSVDHEEATRSTATLVEGALPVAVLEARTAAPARLWIRGRAAFSAGSMSYGASGPRSSDVLASGELTVGARGRLAGPMSIVGYAGATHDGWRHDLPPDGPAGRSDRRLWAALVGGRLEARGSDRFEIAIDAALAPTLSSSVATTGPDGRFDPEGGLGLRARIAMTFRFDPGFTLIVEPWFEQAVFARGLRSAETSAYRYEPASRVQRTGVTLLAGWMF